MDFSKYYSIEIINLNNAKLMAENEAIFETLVDEMNLANNSFEQFCRENIRSKAAKILAGLTIMERIFEPLIEFVNMKSRSLDDYDMFFLEDHFNNVRYLYSHLAENKSELIAIMNNKSADKTDYMKLHLIAQNTYSAFEEYLTETTTIDMILSSI